MEQKNELINPLSLSADIKVEMVREARAASKEQNKLFLKPNKKSD